METKSRKRLRSVESPFTLQSKCFVNQQMVDERDVIKMKQIHEKTIGLLMKAASKSVPAREVLAKRDALQELRLCGNGQLDTKGIKIDWLPEKADRDCWMCGKLSRVHSECSSCFLELCEHCGTSCNCCHYPFCGNCINGSDLVEADGPYCERCKLYN